MNPLADWAWDYDGWIVGTGILCAMAAALPGNFLVLRRMSLLGDAISHAVLPGLVVAFLITGSRASVPMFLGAAVVGVLTALFTEWVRRFGDVDEGAAMGVVFTTLFALGLLGVVRAANQVDLDPGCVLYGAIELTPLQAPMTLGGLNIPPAFVIQACVLLTNLAFIILCWKELTLSAFDPALAAASGISARLMHYLLMVTVAVTAVASFESVGNILVVAMFVVPPATAYLLTHQLKWMVILSCLIAAVAAVSGHLTAIVIPRAFGLGSASTAGMMALCSGVLFLAAALFAPEQGVLVRLVRQRRLTRRILSEDIVAFLYRSTERGAAPATLSRLCSALLCTPPRMQIALASLRRSGLIAGDTRSLVLTEAGRQQGAQLVRSHRLWEHYLASEGHVSSDRLHGQAEQLEHFTDRTLRDRLQQESVATETDPHGRPIPNE